MIKMNGNYIKSIKNNSDIEQIYKSLAEKYGEREDTIEKADRKKIKEIVERNGYICHYDSKEKFYKVILIDGVYKIGYNILLQYGFVKFMLHVFKDGKCIDGGPVGWLFRDEEGRPAYSMPGFSTYEELEEILIPMFEVIASFEAEKVFDQNE